MVSKKAKAEAPYAAPQTRGAARKAASNTASNTAPKTSPETHGAASKAASNTASKISPKTPPRTRGAVNQTASNTASNTTPKTRGAVNEAASNTTPDAAPYTARKAPGAPNNATPSKRRGRPTDDSPHLATKRARRASAQRPNLNMESHQAAPKGPDVAAAMASDREDIAEIDPVSNCDITADVDMANNHKDAAEIDPVSNRDDAAEIDMSINHDDAAEKDPASNRNNTAEIVMANKREETSEIDPVSNRDNAAEIDMSMNHDDTAEKDPISNQKETAEIDMSINHDDGAEKDPASNRNNTSEIEMANKREETSEIDPVSNCDITADVDMAGDRKDAAEVNLISNHDDTTEKDPASNRNDTAEIEMANNHKETSEIVSFSNDKETAEIDIEIDLVSSHNDIPEVDMVEKSVPPTTDDQMQPSDAFTSGGIEEGNVLIRWPFTRPKEEDSSAFTTAEYGRLEELTPDIWNDSKYTVIHLVEKLDEEIIGFLKACGYIPWDELAVDARHKLVALGSNIKSNITNNVQLGRLDFKVLALESLTWHILIDELFSPDCTEKWCGKAWESFGTMLAEFRERLKDSSSHYASWFHTWKFESARMAYALNGNSSDTERIEKILTEQLGRFMTITVEAGELLNRVARMATKMELRMQASPFCYQLGMHHPDTLERSGFLYEKSWEVMQSKDDINPPEKGALVNIIRTPWIRAYGKEGFSQDHEFTTWLGFDKSETSWPMIVYAAKTGK
ncbi:hypothetical protein BKA56DRAFT_665640 [Ilyonectria sp. MPI-CAGE-AT-0026]|nr:hypothetical protein BKA56DRAFT_665640 [Ilyonectria sp. MPI-CAGE-AT-0026]